MLFDASGDGSIVSTTTTVEPTTLYSEDETPYVVLDHPNPVSPTLVLTITVASLVVIAVFILAHVTKKGVVRYYDTSYAQDIEMDVMRLVDASDETTVIDTRFESNT